MDDGFPSDSTFDGFMTIFVIVFVLVLAFGAFSTYRNYTAAKKGGLDPFAVETDLAAKLAKSQLLAAERGAAPEPQKPLEERLAELASLHQRGLITDEELASARKKAIEG